MTQLGAHAIACVQSIHSIPDILAHTFYFSLRLNQVTVLDESKINANSVCKLLEQDPKFQDFGLALKQLTTEGQYKHLRALCNHSKHRSIIQPLLNENWTGKRENRHELRFSSFQYETDSFPEISIKSLLEPEYERSSYTTVEAGKKLNDVLSKLRR